MIKNYPLLFLFVLLSSYLTRATDTKEHLKDRIEAATSPSTAKGTNAAAPSALAENGFSVSANCNVITAPWVENFDGTDWVPGTGAYNTGNQVSQCWSRPSTANPNFGTGSGPTPSSNTGPDDDVTGGGKYLYTEASGAAGAGEITSPRIFIPTTFSNPRLVFNSHLYGGGSISLAVEINNGSGFAQALILNGEQQSGGSAPWHANMLDLSAYIGDTIQIKFIGTNWAFTGDIAIDQVMVIDITCPEPSNLSVNGVTENSVDLSWNTGGASDWLIGYRPAGTTGPVIVLPANTNPFTLTGLSPSTSYDFFVRDSCGAGDLSLWEGPVTASTLCSVYTAPWSENFDGSEWVPGAGGLDNPGSVISHCWTRPTGANPDFSVGNGGTTSANTGPTEDAGGSNGNYLYTEASSSPTGTGEIISPYIYIPTGLGNAALVFEYHMYGADITDLQVSVDNGSGFSTVLTITGQQQTANVDPWRVATADLSSFMGDTVQLLFAGTNSGFNADIAIDEVRIDSNVCVNPSNLQISAITNTGMTLDWTTGGATNWQIEYGVAGFTPGTGTMLSTAQNPQIITGLSPSTEYCFYVRDSCSTGDVSGWISTCAFTACPVYTAPWIENFDGSEWAEGTNATNDNNSISPCWSRPGANNPNFGTGTGTTPSNETGPTADFSGSGNYIYSESSGGNGTGEITTPQIYLPGSIANPHLKFQYHMYGSAITGLEVQVSNGGTYTSVFNLSGQQQTAHVDPWMEAAINLSAYSGDTITIRFLGTTTGYRGDISIDEVSVISVSCPMPDSLQVLGTSSTSATLGWITGGASQWLVKYREVGTTSYSTVAAGSNPFAVTGLNPSTNYEFWVRDSCGAGDLSLWAGPVTASTTCTEVTAPWSENFDGPDWTPGGGAGNAGNAISPCWSRPSSNNPNFGTRSGATISTETGPNSDFSGSGNYIYTEASGASGSGEISSLPIVLPASMANPHLSFQYHMYGNDITSLTVEIIAGSGISQVFTLSGEQQTSSADPWKEALVGLSQFSGDTITIRFTGTNTGYNGDIAIDEVGVMNISCPAPDSLEVVSSTSTSITLDWISGGASQWLVGYREAGASSFTVVPTNSKPFTINGLVPGAAYELMVRDSCAASDVSDWTTVLIQPTSCGVVSAPWSESFDGPNWQEGTIPQNDNDQISACWSRATNTGIRWGTGTGVTPSNYTGPDDDQNGGGNYLYTEASLGNGSPSIETPWVFIPANFMDASLKYFYHMYGAGINNFTVEMDNGSGYQTLSSISGQQQASHLAAWAKDSIDISGHIGDTVRFRFTGSYTTYMGDMAIDQVSVDGNINLCPDPSQFSISNIGPTTATVAWNGNAGVSQLEFVESGQPQGSGTTIAGAVSPVTLNNLLPNTGYDLYVRDSCSGIFSNWIDTSFTTGICPSVSVDFTAQDNYLTASFDASNSLGADTLFWDFGDGNSGSGVHPNHSYTGPGTYQVTLIGTNFCGNSDTLVKQIQVCDILTADFTMNLGGDSVSVDASISSGASSYYWNFGPGMDTSGTTLTFVYETSGTKTVHLIVVNLCGDSISTSKTFKICKPPKADWTYTVIATTGNGMEVQFDGSLSQNATSFHWDFGDGTTVANLVQPTHTYLTPGLFYTVKLTVANDCGGQDVRKFRMDKIGLEEAGLLAKLELYPNPAEDRVMLEWPAQDISVKRIEITDASGKIIERKLVEQNTEGKLELDLSKLSTGYYLLLIDAGKGIAKKQLIVK